MSAENNLTLYGYWRSSAAYRVRIALNLKGLEYQSHSVHLVRDGGEQHSSDYHALNPTELVPTLIHNGLVIGQSMTILEYLDDTFPLPCTLPAGVNKYLAKSLAYDIAMDLHPINNLRVLQYLKEELSCTDEQSKQWYQHWVRVGFKSIEEKLAKLAEQNLNANAGGFVFGQEPTIADICLIPQVYNAIRFEVDLSEFPMIESIWIHANTHKAFQDASPENQPDAVS